MDRRSNPFQAIEVSFHRSYKEEFNRYCKTGKGQESNDRRPFPRMVDMWFFSICLAVRLGLEPEPIPSPKDMYKLIEGSIFGSDSWRIEILQLVAAKVAKNFEVVRDPREVMRIATCLALAGMPRVLEMLKGAGDPIWNLGDALREMLEEQDC